MKIIIHANRIDWQQAYLPRFTAGFVAHGHRVVHSDEDKADESGINVIFANNSWKLVHQQCINKHIPLITVGRCMFGSRHDMVAIGWDGFNGVADFCLDDEMPDDRWQKHGHSLTSVRYGDADGYVLVCGEFREMGKWYGAMREILAGEDVCFRPHPFKTGQAVPGWRFARKVGQDDLSSLFPDCRVVITYDSIAGCDAVLAGVPSIACGENSMARPVSFNSWRHFRKFYEDGLPDETEGKMSKPQWANRLAYCQWSHDEIEAGDFWTHLLKGCETRMESANAHAHLSKTTKMRKHHRLMGWN